MRRWCPNPAASTIVLLAGLALAQAGCSLKSPYSPPARAAQPTAARDARDPAPERGGHIPIAVQAAQQKLTPGAAEPSARAALERYAQLAVNWNWRQLADRERRLASISLGQARAQALAAAAQVAANSTLRAQRVTNTGRLVSIAPGRGPAAGRWVIVTLEQTRGHGPYARLPQTLHVTYAQVTHTPGGYVVDQWHPQS